MTDERMGLLNLVARHKHGTTHWRHWLGRMSSAAGFMALAGCAVFNQDAVDRHQDGWKPGTVKRIGPADQLGEHLKHDCRGDGAATGDVFALVSYPHGKTWHYAIAPVAANSPVAVGQEVWVPTRNCQFVESR